LLLDSNLPFGRQKGDIEFERTFPLYQISQDNDIDERWEN